ncbi:hypothetical protein [Paraburkholderia sp. J10-1]|uniref:hypothetical protein n=1 Tax=Paraburkholderia sp. J10-1 TaxID=2805430 RepID=UPI002AB718E2|nr:hypothetical protein [Paraburkholderia sp. J10-1]
MRIELHIERVVLEDLGISPGSRDALEAALRAELGRLLETESFARSRARTGLRGDTVRSVRGAPLVLPEHAAHGQRGYAGILGARIASSLAGSIAGSISASIAARPASTAAPSTRGPAAAGGSR